jgi:hypothetical protein
VRCSLANRACPQCGTPVRIIELLPFSNSFECSNCHTKLAAGAPGGSLAAWAGLAAGVIVYRLSRNAGGPVGVFLPELYSVLAFGIVSPLVLALIGSVERAPVEEVVVVVEVAGASGQGASHGGGHH